MIELAALLIVAVVGTPIALFLLWAAAMVAYGALYCVVCIIAAPILLLERIDKAIIARFGKNARHARK